MFSAPSLCRFRAPRVPDATQRVSVRRRAGTHLPVYGAIGVPALRASLRRTASGTRILAFVHLHSAPKPPIWTSSQWPPREVKVPLEASESQQQSPQDAPHEPILTLPAALTAYVVLLAVIHLRVLLPPDTGKLDHRRLRLHSQALRFNAAADPFPGRHRRKGLDLRHLFAAACQSQPYRLQRAVAVAVRQRAGAALWRDRGSSSSWR